MTKPELIALAERVEAATGPSYELNVEITRIVRGFPESWPEAYDGALVTDFSGSLDAAMTMEGGLLVALSDIAADGLMGCCLVSDTSTNPPKEHWGIANGDDHTGRLARCYVAAALRSRAQDIGEAG